MSQVFKYLEPLPNIYNLPVVTWESQPGKFNLIVLPMTYLEILENGLRKYTKTLCLDMTPMPLLTGK